MGVPLTIKSDNCYQYSVQALATDLDFLFSKIICTVVSFLLLITTLGIP